MRNILDVLHRLIDSRPLNEAEQKLAHELVSAHEDIHHELHPPVNSGTETGQEEDTGEGGE